MRKHCLPLLHRKWVQKSTPLKCKVFWQTIQRISLFAIINDIHQHEQFITVHCFELDGLSMRGVIATQVLYLQSRMICPKVLAFQTFLEQLFKFDAFLID